MPSEASLANLRPPWQPGKSAYVANAKGHRRVLAMARRASPEAMQAIIDCALDKNASWRERIPAALAVIERAWGKSQERLTLEGADGANIVIVTGVPRNEDATQPVAAETTFTIEYNAGEEET
jgi:hypothetical protein